MKTKKIIMQINCSFKKDFYCTKLFVRNNILWKLGPHDHISYENTLVVFKIFDNVLEIFFKYGLWCSWMLLRCLFIQTLSRLIAIMFFMCSLKIITKFEKISKLTKTRPYKSSFWILFLLKQKIKNPITYLRIVIWYVTREPISLPHQNIKN